VIPPDPDWLDSCCWRCGSLEVVTATGGRLLCSACRRELFTEPAMDAVALARHAYWESHALRCCWRCITGAVDPDDELGMCAVCRQEIGRFVEEGAA
jgi:hypothetical protein